MAEEKGNTKEKGKRGRKKTGANRKIPWDEET